MSLFATCVEHSVAILFLFYFMCTYHKMYNLYYVQFKIACTQKHCYFKTLDMMLPYMISRPTPITSEHDMVNRPCRGRLDLFPSTKVNVGKKYSINNNDIVLFLDVSTVSQISITAGTVTLHYVLMT